MPQSPDRKLGVTFLPKSEWERDEARANCTSCKRGFSMCVRRHHCRLCGQIFCSGCSVRRVWSKRCCAECYVRTTQILKVKRQRAKERWLQQTLKINGESKQRSQPGSPESTTSSRSRISAPSSPRRSGTWRSLLMFCCQSDDARLPPMALDDTTPPMSPPQTAVSLHLPSSAGTSPATTPPRSTSTETAYGLGKRPVTKSISCTSLASIYERSSEEEEDEAETTRGGSRHTDFEDDTHRSSSTKCPTPSSGKGSALDSLNSPRPQVKSADGSPPDSANEEGGELFEDADDSGPKPGEERTVPTIEPESNVTKEEVVLRTTHTRTQHARSSSA